MQQVWGKSFRRLKSFPRLKAIYSVEIKKCAADGFQIQGLKRVMSNPNTSESEDACHSMRSTTSFLPDDSGTGETAANLPSSHPNTHHCFPNSISSPPVEFQVDWVAKDIAAFTEYLENEVLRFCGSLFDAKDMARKVLIVRFSFFFSSIPTPCLSRV
jgi:hypothetical protein